MNKSTAIFLVRDDIRCISVAYDKAVDHKGKPVGKDIKSFKTADPNIKPLDLVIIPTDSRWGFTIGRVEQVDLHVDFDSSELMRWVAGTINTAEFDRVNKLEADMMGLVAEADRNHRQDELKKKMFQHVNPEAMAALGIKHPAKDTMLSPPPAAEPYAEPHADVAPEVSPAPAPTRSGFEPEDRGGAQVHIHTGPRDEDIF